MARNVEIKARIAAVAALAPLAARLADAEPTVIEQDDTFFSCPNGRLKLREQRGAGAELIFYRRPDQSGPKESFYLRVPVADAAAMRALLEQAHGQSGRVRKRRMLYLVGRTRIHLDVVEALESSWNWKSCCGEGEPAAEGVMEARRLMAELGVAPGQLLEGAYVDQLALKPQSGRC
ncbi:MAG: class IV adenylate cyclase [Steroidobacteraceae bacterium]